MKLTKYIMACILAFSLAGCIDDEPSNNPITYGDEIGRASWRERV